ncbi:MAG: hypothetical protein HQK65_09790 [Desulfamplus sp.]|nr:hypothetical protein [Desulfamplus sp.]
MTITTIKKTVLTAIVLLTSVFVINVFAMSGNHGSRDCNDNYGHMSSNSYDHHKGSDTNYGVTNRSGYGQEDEYDSEPGK